MSSISTHREPHRPAFVPLAPSMQAAVIVFLLLVTTAAGVGAMLNARPTLIPLYALFLVYVTVLAIPLVSDLPREGVFQPLVFYVLLHGVVGLLRSEAIIAAGG